MVTMSIAANIRSVVYAVLIIAIVLFCAYVPIGCFTARTYGAPPTAREVRVFDRYVISVYVGNTTAATYNYSKNDFTYLLRAGIQADSNMIDSSSMLECRLSNLCISGVCLNQVYCPPCDQDSAMLRFGPYLSYYDCGLAEIPKECKEFIMSFDAILVDTVADTTVESEHVQMTLEKSERKIPAILPI